MEGIKNIPNYHTELRPISVCIVGLLYPLSHMLSVKSSFCCLTPSASHLLPSRTNCIISCRNILHAYRMGNGQKLPLLNHYPHLVCRGPWLWLNNGLPMEAQNGFSQYSTNLAQGSNSLGQMFALGPWSEKGEVHGIVVWVGSVPPWSPHVQWVLVKWGVSSVNHLWEAFPLPTTLGRKGFPADGLRPFMIIPKVLGAHMMWKKGWHQPTPGNVVSWWVVFIRHF